MDSESTGKEPADDTEGHPAFTEGGVAPVKTVTDDWSTSQPNPDATIPGSMPKAVADEIDEKDHSDDAVAPDSGGTVLDEAAAEANRKGP